MPGAGRAVGIGLQRVQGEFLDCGLPVNGVRAEGEGGGVEEPAEPGEVVVIDSGGSPLSDTRRMMLEAIGTFLDAGRIGGTTTAGVDAADMLAAVTGIALSVGKPGQREQAERLIALAVAGLTVPR